MLSYRCIDGPGKAVRRFAVAAIAAEMSPGDTGRLRRDAGLDEIDDGTSEVCRMPIGHELPRGAPGTTRRRCR